MPALAFSQTARSSLPGATLGQVALEQAVAHGQARDRPRAWSPSCPRRRRRARRAAPATSGVGRQIASSVRRRRRRPSRAIDVSAENAFAAASAPAPWLQVAERAAPRRRRPQRRLLWVQRRAIEARRSSTQKSVPMLTRAVVAEHGAVRLLEPPLRAGAGADRGGESRGSATARAAGWDRSPSRVGAGVSSSSRAPNDEHRPAVDRGAAVERAAGSPSTRARPGWSRGRAGTPGSRSARPPSPSRRAA